MVGVSRSLVFTLIMILGSHAERSFASTTCRSANDTSTADRALLGEEDAIVELFDEAFDGCIDLPKSMLALATQFAYGNHPQGIGQGAWALYKNAEGESEIAEPYLRLGLVIFAARNGSCPALADRILTAHEMGLGSNRVFQPWLDEAAAQGNGTARLYRALRDVEEDPKCH